jgi:hypothetical protein
MSFINNNSINVLKSMKNFTLLIALCAIFTGRLVAQPTTVAPTPTLAATDVVSLWNSSGTYTNIAVADWFPNWSQATVVSDFSIGAATVKKYTNLNYQGIIMPGANGISLRNMTKMHIDVWSTDCSNLNVYLISPGHETPVTLSPNGTTGWLSADFDLSVFSAAGVVLDNMFQMKVDGTTGSTFYLDNLYFWKPSNVPTIGLTVPAKAQGDAPFTLAATSPSGGAITYMSSNSSVATVSGSTVTIVGAGNALITANQAASGAYVAGAASAYLTVAAAGPQTAAPTPTRSASIVTSMFSDAYTDVAGTNWDAFHGGGVVASEVTIAGNPTKKYENLSYLGAQTSPGMNLSARTHLHLDIWTLNPSTNFRVKLVNFATPNTEAEVSVSPNAGGGVWKSYDIDLSTFPASLTSRANISQFIISSTTASQTFWVDNIYFYTDPTTVVTAPTTAAPTPTRLPANVISMFSNAYTNIGVTTWLTGWSPSPIALAEVQIAGNDTKKYTGINTYFGVDLASVTNITASDFMHLDVWTPTAIVPNAFNVKLVDFGADGGYQGTPNDDTAGEVPVVAGVAAGTWTPLDIPMTAFVTAGLTNRAHLAQLVISAPANATIFIDNVYFYKTPATTPTVAATAPTLPAVNVISLFSDMYTNRIMGWNKYGTGPTYEEVSIGGNNTQKYTGLGYSIAEPTVVINPGNATFMHLDVWSPTTIVAGAFKVKLVDYGANRVNGFSPTSGDDTEGEVGAIEIPAATWTALDIPFAAFQAAGLTSNAQNLGQFIPSGGGTIFMDNIYFYATVALTVELTTLKGKLVNNTTVLTWQTASEKDNRGFTIERSNDATHYTAIGEVKGNGTTNAESNYTFTDATPLSGVNYYRLRQADFNGKETMSKVVAILTSKGGLFIKNTLVHDVLDVTVGDASKGPLSIFNISGQLVYSTTVSGSQQINLSALNAGMYIVRTSTGEVSRFVKD